MFVCLFDASLFCAESVGRLGLNVSLQSFKEEALQAQQLGIGTIRVNVPWQEIAPKEVVDDQHRGEEDVTGPADEQPGEFNWSALDRLVDAAHQYRMEIVLTVRSISSWGTKNMAQGRGVERSSSAPALMRHWTFFLSSLAKRYKGQGVCYEIENEVGNKMFWDGTQEEYSALLKASYDAIKYVDEAAQVLAAAVDCGIARHLTTPAAQQEFRVHLDSWWRAILSTKAFDIVSIHDYYYPGNGAEVNGFTFRGYLQHVLQLMKEAHVEALPVWITAAGFVSSPAQISGRTDSGSADKQAQWLKEAYAQAFDAGVERIFWVLLNDQSRTYFGAMGLNDPEGKHRSAWTALKETAHRIK